MPLGNYPARTFMLQLKRMELRQTGPDANAGRYPHVMRQVFTRRVSGRGAAW